MSNYPPPPPPGQPQYPPQGQSYPQQPFGQQQQFPGQYPAPRTTSGAAIVSLICGLLFCIPIVTGLIAVITGIFGIKSTGRPNVGGRGMAITGLILGLLALIGWPLVGLGVYGATKAAYAMAQKSGVEFTNAIIAGDYDKALKFTASGMKKEELEKMNQDMQGWGELTSIGFPSNLQTQKNIGGDVIEVTAPATFSKAGAKQMTITLITEKDPTTKVDELKIGGISFK